MLPFFSEHIQDRKQPIPQIMKNQLFSRERENKEKNCGGEKKQISGEKNTLKHIVFKCEKNARNIFQKENGAKNGECEKSL
jgi:hypothetical protein